MSDTFNKDPLRILSSTCIPTRPESHFDVGDGWKTVLIGEEQRRPKSLERIAYTRVEMTFDSEEAYSEFFKQIRESDARLGSVPDDKVMYDWQEIRRKGLAVRFGVAWYDNAFYQQRKDAYLSSDHETIFRTFGITPRDLRVEHIPI